MVSAVKVRKRRGIRINHKNSSRVIPHSFQNFRNFSFILFLSFFWSFDRKPLAGFAPA